MAKIRAIGKSGQCIKQLGDFFSYFRTGGEEAEVGVESSGFGVVVACAEMDIAFESVVFAANDHAGLTVGLESDEAINNVNTDIFELAGPLDIVGFIESGLDLDQHGNLLTVV